LHVAAERDAMWPIDFHSLSLWLNAGIFAGAAALVWLAGTRLADYADIVSSRTGISKALLGMLMLGVATSLPEIATTVTGAAIGNAPLVAGNLFGGVAMQMAILAIADLVAVRGALTFFAPQPVLLFQGVMLLLLLGAALAGSAASDPLAVGGVGLTPILLFGGYLLTVRASQGGDYLPRWRATNEPDARGDSTGAEDRRSPLSDTRLYVASGTAATVILVAGWLLARTGDALAVQTNLGASFVGVALVAGSTSLPELSTTIGAVRRGNHQMAVSNILGTNCLELALFFLADLVYRGGPILAETDQSAMFAGALGVVVTSIFLLGLLERRDRTVLRMGVDSLAVLVIYVSGLAGLYALR
jgi:cation:H+ antiporter